MNAANFRVLKPLFYTLRVCNQPPVAPHERGGWHKSASAGMAAAAVVVSMLLGGQALGKVAAPETKNPFILIVARLYENLEFDTALSTIPKAVAWPNNGPQELLWLELMEGVLQFAAGNEGSALSAFKRALTLDPGAQLPVQPSDGLRNLLAKAKSELGPPAPDPVPDTPASVQPPASAAQPEAPPPVRPRWIESPATAKEPSRPPDALRTWGFAVGGTGVALVLGGAVAGTMALSAHEAQKNASASGDWEGYLRHRDAAGTAAMAANGFYATGAVALGAGAVLFLSAPGAVKVGAVVEPSKLSIAVGGSF